MLQLTFIIPPNFGLALIEILHRKFPFLFKNKNSQKILKNVIYIIKHRKKGIKEKKKKRKSGL